LANEGVDVDGKAVRARKPNANSLAAFAEKTTLINTPKPSKKSSAAKRKRANTVKSVTTVAEPEGGAQEGGPSELLELSDHDPQDQLRSEQEEAIRLSITDSQSQEPSQEPTSSVLSSPLVKRAKSTPVLRSSPPVNATFDPTVQAPTAHVVLTEICVEIASKEQEVISRSYDINDGFIRPYETIIELAMNRRVKPWADIRRLGPTDQPVLQSMTVILGKGANLSSIGVEDMDDWHGVEANLRMRRHLGHSKSYSTMKIKLKYTVPDRPTTPPPDSKAKAKAKNVRKTVLISSDSSSSDSNDEPTPRLVEVTSKSKKKKKHRESATTRQLDAKGARDSANNDVQALRLAIFKANKCDDFRCDNYLHCCFKLRSKGSHHKVNTQEQEEWAEIIASNEDSTVSITQPPIDWITRYQTGWRETRLKRSGSNKSEPVQQIHHHYPLPTAIPASLQPQPTLYHPENDPIHALVPPRRDIRGEVIPPSSPLRTQEVFEDPIRAFLDYMIDNSPEEKHAKIHEAFTIIIAEDYEVDQLKDTDTQDALHRLKIPGGLLKRIGASVSEFKKLYKLQRLAIKGFPSLYKVQGRQGTSSSKAEMRRQMGRERGEEGDHVDFYDDD
jgi:hypothetical protein